MPEEPNLTPPTQVQQEESPGETPAESHQENFSREYVEKLRQEAASYRKTAKELKTQLDQMDQARLQHEAEEKAEQGKYQELYQAERLQREQERQMYLNELKRNELRVRLMSAGAVDADIYKLVNLSNIRVEDPFFDSDITSAVEELKAAKPYLFKNGTAAKSEPARVPQGVSTTGMAVPPGAVSSPSQLMQKPFTVANLSPDEYLKAKEEAVHKFREGYRRM